MCLISSPLQELQRRGPARQTKALLAARKKNLFVALGKARDGKGLDTVFRERFQGGVQLSLATVYDHQVGQFLLLCNPSGNEP